MHNITSFQTWKNIFARTNINIWKSNENFKKYANMSCPLCTLISVPYYNVPPFIKFPSKISYHLRFPHISIEHSWCFYCASGTQQCAFHHHPYDSSGTSQPTNQPATTVRLRDNSITYFPGKQGCKIQQLLKVFFNFSYQRIHALAQFILLWV